MLGLDYYCKKSSFLLYIKMVKKCLFICYTTFVAFSDRRFLVGTSIRISDEAYAAAKKAAKAQHRSIQGQIEYWSQIGRCAIDNPDLPIEMIQELLSTDWKDDSDATPFTFGKNDD
jgi:hypothetical protein